MDNHNHIDVHDYYEWSSRMAEHWGHVLELMAFKSFLRGGRGGRRSARDLQNFIKQREREHTRQLNSLSTSLKKMAAGIGRTDVLELLEQTGAGNKDPLKKRLVDAGRTDILELLEQMEQMAKG